MKIDFVGALVKPIVMLCAFIGAWTIANTCFHIHIVGCLVLAIIVASAVDSLPDP